MASSLFSCLSCSYFKFINMNRTLQGIIPTTVHYFLYLSSKQPGCFLLNAEMFCQPYTIGSFFTDNNFVEHFKSLVNIKFKVVKQGSWGRWFIVPTIGTSTTKKLFAFYIVYMVTLLTTISLTPFFDWQVLITVSGCGESRLELLSVQFFQHLHSRFIY